MADMDVVANRNSLDDGYLGLGRAAQETPGRPSANCVWRWCRRGVKSPSGERVRLRHIRVGGKIYTKRSWLEEFWRALAERDVAYFDAKLAAAAMTPPRDPAYAPPARRRRNPTTAINSMVLPTGVAEELDREGI